MLASSGQRPPDTLDGFLDRRVPRYFEAKAPGDGIDLGRY